MKRFFPLFCLLSFICSSKLSAQFLDLSIPSGELPSDISSWSLDPKLMTISFAVPDGIKIENGHIIFEVTAGPEQILASTRSRFAEQPLISGTFKKKSFSYSSVVNSGALELDTSSKSILGHDGKLPAGFFSLCFYLVDAEGKPVKDIFQGCTNFFVRDIDPVTLLTPLNESVVSPNTQLSFSWTAARVTTQEIHYQLKLFPVYTGQTALQAMASSTAFYKSDDIFSTTFMYPSDAPQLNSLTDAKGFTWVVTQMDQNGKTLGKNYGRSAPGIFYKKAD